MWLVTKRQGADSGLDIPDIYYVLYGSSVSISNFSEGGTVMSVFEISPLVNGKGLRLAGELDLAAAPRLTEALLDFASAEGEVHLDLTEVSFLDSSGLRVILALARSRRDKGPSSFSIPPRPSCESSRSRGSTSIRGLRYGTRAPSR